MRSYNAFGVVISNDIESVAIVLRSSYWENRRLYNLEEQERRKADVILDSN
jgi:hypothetical protein